mmetsp:Transcript_635/g.1998  ORF Transcript_635/g.1998 Transcript_635/m.1998 type:complete len:289 (+) Transcript_635:93-959(+)
MRIFVSAPVILVSLVAVSAAQPGCDAGLSADAAAGGEGLHLLSRSVRAIVGGAQPASDGMHRVLPSSPRMYADTVPEGYRNPVPAKLRPLFPDRVWHRSSYNCSMPIVSWLSDSFPAAVSHGVEILDVGGGNGGLEDFVETKTGRKWSWACVDVEASESCKEYRGDRLQGVEGLPEKSKDVVMFVDVLHHAVESTIDLLRDAARLSRCHVVVLEDLLAEDYSQALMEFHHEWRGFYRSEYEWEKIFELLGYKVAFKQSPEPLCAFPDVFHVHRMAWVLETPGSSCRAL